MTPQKTPRAFPRQPKRLKVTSPHAAAFTLDVGFGGMCLETNKALTPGGTITGTVSIGGLDLPFEGLVAWATQGDLRVGLRARSGIRFTKVSDGFAAALKVNRPAAPSMGLSMNQVPSRPRAAPTPSAPRAAGRAPTVTLQGEVWVVHAASGTGKVQEFRCVQEADARRLAMVLAG